MSNYILKESKSKKINKLEVHASYFFNPKKYKNLKITIYDEEKINKILCNNLLKKYQKLQSIIDDDSSDGNVQALSEIDKMINLLNVKYQNYLKKEVYEIFLNNLILERKKIENKLNNLDSKKSR